MRTAPAAHPSPAIPTLVRALVEVLAGQRPTRHLQPFTVPGVAHGLAATRQRRRELTIRSIRAQAVLGVAALEVTITVDEAQVRTHPLAMRIERRRGELIITAVVTDLLT